MKKTNVIGLFLFAVLISSQVSQAEEYREPGRQGFQLSVTEDTVFPGYTYRSEKIDFVVNFSGHSYIGTNQPYQFPINFHIGYRFNLGDHNYFATGLAANFVVAGEDYGNTSANQQVAPNDPTNTPTNIFGMGRYGNYISLQRHFPHSNLMIELATMPYAYQLNILGDGKGNKIISHDHRFFESGFVGIAYLFGTSGDDLDKK